MRKYISLLVCASALAAFSVTCSAQQEKEYTPKWVSPNGYWVVESNIKTPLISIVYFYNNDNQLIYKEKLDGVRINIKKRKTLMDLRKILEASVVAWNAKQSPGENRLLVANTFKSHE
jgi:hypothetical protein